MKSNAIKIILYNMCHQKMKYNGINKKLKFKNKILIQIQLMNVFKNKSNKYYNNMMMIVKIKNNINKHNN